MNQVLPPTSPEMPPMIARSASYRCDDGQALYVDYLTDSSMVNVRDSRADLPVLLKTEGESDTFQGEDRTLRATGDEITYSSPKRPNQKCRAGDA